MNTQQESLQVSELTEEQLKAALKDIEEQIFNVPEGNFSNKRKFVIKLIESYYLDLLATELALQRREYESKDILQGLPYVMHDGEFFLTYNREYEVWVTGYGGVAHPNASGAVTGKTAKEAISNLRSWLIKDNKITG